MVSRIHDVGKTGRRVLAGTLVILLLASSATAQTLPGAAAGSGARAIPSTRPAYSRVEKVPEELFDESRRSAVMLPSSPGEGDQAVPVRAPGVRKRAAADGLLLPEGYMVASRAARIAKQGDWFIAELGKSADLPDSPPLRVLPNQQLSMLQAILAQSAAPTSFLITGRITEFQGANYILIENIEEVITIPARDSAPAEPSAATEPPSPATPGGKEPTAEEVLKQLLERPARRSVALPQLTQIIPAEGPGSTTATAESRPGVAPATGSLLPERALMIDRVGRVVPGEKWWTLVFENRGQQAADKPIRLLPSRLLESAVSLSKGGTQSAVFLVSGEITTYENNNYLLLRKALLRRHGGNIR